MLRSRCRVRYLRTYSFTMPIYEAQLLTHLKLSDHRLGFLVNWNVILIKDGIKRMVNRL